VVDFCCTSGHGEGGDVGLIAIYIGTGEVIDLSSFGGGGNSNERRDCKFRQKIAELAQDWY